MTKSQIQSQIDSITDQLIKKYKPQKIFLFGSSVTGNMTDDSDLDFLIIKDDRRNFHDRVVEIYKLVEKNIAADFIVYTPKEVSERVRIGDPFIKSILSEGRVLYG
ncbi:nucleotidyltransferase domain-containing protein [Candidatus Daviesbacteria bacterium]|nr:nucleotidyltransferase domain-containing protein [Candidatus Daviesbacteria bacterium]